VLHRDKLGWNNDNIKRHFVFFILIMEPFQCWEGFIILQGVIAIEIQHLQHMRRSSWWRRHKEWWICLSWMFRPIWVLAFNKW